MKHGRYKWQLDLAQALIADALGKEWGRTEAERGEKARPWWSRKVEWYPCDCKGCFHCAAQMTTGLTSPQQQASTGIFRFFTSDTDFDPVPTVVPWNIRREVNAERSTVFLSPLSARDEMVLSRTSRGRRG